MTEEQGEKAGQDGLQWGYSLANVSEILIPCLEAAGVKSVLEIGAFEGDLTEVLLDWSARSRAEIATVEPLPPDRLLELKSRRPELELIEDTGVGALEGLDRLPDAVVIDGDHNYYTLSQELATIARKADGGQLPLLLFHDVCWPHERRDTYYEPERVPESERMPLAHNCTLAPGNPGLSDGGLPFEWAAAHEGGPKNGVLTAIEDFVSRNEGLKLARVPIFFGFGLLWREDADWAGEVDRLIAPYDENPVLRRAEANRVAHLVRAHVDAAKLRELDHRVARYEELLSRMLSSSALSLAEKLSYVKQRGNPIFSRQEIRDLLNGKHL